LSGAALWLLVLSPATAQQSDAPLGSPAATRVIDGLQLPAPGVPFGGTIEPNALDSRPFWSPRIAPPEGAPGLPPLKWSSLRYGF
jgi:arylsulfatase